MKQKQLNIILLFLSMTSIMFAADKKIVIDSLSVHNSSLNLSYHINGLFNEENLRAIDKGITSQVVHHIQLWKKQKIVSPVIAEHFYPVKVYFDNWQNKYVIVSEDENRLTSKIETIQDVCSKLVNFSLTDTTNLEKDVKYYISIQTTFQPISTETYQALKSWLGDGGKQPDPKAPKQKNGRLFNVLVDIMGFGDKVIPYKSKTFILTETGQITFVK